MFLIEKRNPLSFKQKTKSTLDKLNLYVKILTVKLKILTSQINGFFQNLLYKYQ
jgi:hypothetical protein